MSCMLAGLVIPYGVNIYLESHRDVTHRHPPTLKEVRQHDVPSRQTGLLLRAMGGGGN